MRTKLKGNEKLSKKKPFFSTRSTRLMGAVSFWIRVDEIFRLRMDEVLFSSTPIEERVIYPK